MSIIRTKKYYTVLRTTFINALNLTDVLEITWDGGNFIVRHTDTETVNNPINNITRIIENYEIIPWTQIYSSFFSSIPISKFERMSVGFDATTIFVYLNLEE